MRELKFRAWDPDFAEMLKVDAIVFDTRTINNGMTEPHIYDEHNDLHSLSEVILMQFTGLHDRNGKEIFDGDIVKLCDTNPVLFKVEIILGKYGYKTVFKHLDDGTVAGSYFLDKCEVIGNIYENPELLKEGSK